MPISPANLKRYPDDWPDIRRRILARAGKRCEGSPAYPDCRAHNGHEHPDTGSLVVLAVAHLDHEPSNNDPANLRALCRRCHNTHDMPHRRANRARTLARRKARGDLFDGDYR